MGKYAKVVQESLAFSELRGGGHWALFGDALEN